VMSLLKKQWSIKTKIAFGPHLALGLAIMWCVEQFWI
jgi:prepilin signal peptidase PulO-like enzyme (type II secretory pathway)